MVQIIVHKRVWVRDYGTQQNVRLRPGTYELVRSDIDDVWASADVPWVLKHTRIGTFGMWWHFFARHERVTIVGDLPSTKYWEKPA